MTTQTVALTRAIEYLAASAGSDSESAAQENIDNYVSVARADLDQAFAFVNATPDLESLYTSPNLPEGYDTVLGYLSRERPEIVDLMSDPIGDTLKDSFTLKADCVKDDATVETVDAPPALRERGIMQINAYPLEYLATRFG
jgi:hypothetical protein